MHKKPAYFVVCVTGPFSLEWYELPVSLTRRRVKHATVIVQIYLPVYIQMREKKA